MTHLGRFQLGDWVPIVMQAVTAAGTPALPDDAPTATVFAASDPTSAIATRNLPIRDRYGTTALFGADLRLDGDYAAGSYLVVLQWAHSTTGHGDLLMFDVVGGGDADGNVIGQYVSQRPEGQMVVYQLDSGKLQIAMNPR